jgi:hypothetical protein
MNVRVDSPHFDCLIFKKGTDPHADFHACRETASEFNPESDTGADIEYQSLRGESLFRSQKNK